MNKILKLLEEDHAKHISSHINWAEETQVPFTKEGKKEVYSDPITESLLLFLKPKIEEVYDKELVPTYSYWRTYYKNQCLVPHRDRPSCEVSLTLTIDASDKNAIWGIYVDGTEYKPQIGEGVIYKGCEQEHWRNDLPYDWHRQVFLHYIEKDGANYPEYVFDKRENLYFDMHIAN